ncbi:uncharacterized protein LAJ45_02933 [Morchella importuna]|nr:uncharacterized protein LAJ45_02933 [Morchella importuna]KAH8152709.1 hypothetical protein LAJ45_02933 [Morchella importuna]
MPTTPGGVWSSLKASEEVERISDVVDKTQWLSATKLNCPTTAKVTTEMPLHDVIHFACHGDSDDNSPSNSALILQKNEEEIDRLTVEQMSHMNLRDAQIAYLSACSTAENSSKLALADESLFIASAFQLAGFNHVLATRWASFDDACLIVATEFYKLLFEGGPHGNEREGGHRRVSLVFHKAVLRLREMYRAQPIKWASFIHTGA